MTEFKKKQNGEIYDARNLELRSQQNRAKNLARKFNDLPAEDMEGRIQTYQNYSEAVAKTSG